MTAWDVLLETWREIPGGGTAGGERVIDTVFYDDDCDADYVRRGLIEHDGYDFRIRVRNCKTLEEYPE